MTEDYPKVDPDLTKRFTEFSEEFKNETDRAAVILGAAKLDYMLYRLFVQYLIPNPSGQDDLFDSNGPLSNFSAKINMAYRLGLIDRDFARAIHLVRRIRNSFAHEVSGCTLDSGPHHDRVSELVSPYDKMEGFLNFKKAFFGDKTGTRADFYTILGIMVARLEFLLEDVAPVTDQHAWSPIG